MMLIAKRLMANIVDVFVFLAIVVAFFAFILPSFFVEELPYWAAGLALVGIAAATFMVQYPFLRVHQTIGKGFFGLKIVSTNEQRPLTVGIILAREVFAKIMTGYLLCLPVLVGKQGKHDEACETDVI